jgi:hypothetical protein
MINILRKLAIIQRGDVNNSGNDTVVILNNISEGVDGSSIFGLTSEPNNLPVNNNQTYINKKNHALDIRVLKPTGDAYVGKTNLQQLKDWSSNQTELYIVALTLDGAIFFGDYETQKGLVKIAINEQLSNADVFAIKVTSASEVGFNSSTGLHEGGFWAGKNIIGGYEWGDADSDGLANGWTASGFTSQSFSSGVQQLESGTSNKIFKRQVYFPFEDEKISFGIEFFNAITGDISLLDLRISYKDSSNSLIGSSDNESISSIGLKNNSSTVVSNTVSISLGVVLAATAGTLNVEVKNPVLNLGSSSSYTKF